VHRCCDFLNFPTVGQIKVYIISYKFYSTYYTLLVQFKPCCFVIGINNKDVSMIIRRRSHLIENFEGGEVVHLIGVALCLHVASSFRVDAFMPTTHRSHNQLSLSNACDVYTARGSVPLHPITGTNRPDNDVTTRFTRQRCSRWEVGGTWDHDCNSL